MCATACGGHRATFKSQFAPSAEGSGIDQVTRLVRQVLPAEPRPWALQSSLEGINDACASDTQYPFQMRLLGLSYAFSISLKKFNIDNFPFLFKKINAKTTSPNWLWVGRQF